MSTTQNTNNSEKQIVFRVTEAQHQEIRIQAAIAGSLTPNQYAKKYLLEKLSIKATENDSEQNQS